MSTYRPILAGIALVAMLCGPAPAQFIDMRLSVKIIVHPVTGVPPDNITPVVFQTAIAAANQWMASYERGYRFVLSEVVQIGGPSGGGTNGPSQWFGQNFTGNFPGFQAVAEPDARYFLRTNMVNIYVTTALVAEERLSGGAMPIPPGETDLILGQIFPDNGPWWVVHELGHFFGLFHTFGSCRNCSPPNTGDDGIADTLPEGANYTRDQIAQRAYGLNYSNLTPEQQLMVDNTYFNVMSYHEATNKNTTVNRLTELQLDRWAFRANFDRQPFVSAQTFFVSTAGNNAGSGLSGGLPKRTVASAVTAAAPGDTILLRPGSYNEAIHINKAVTLRATRSGPATIGQP